MSNSASIECMDDVDEYKCESCGQLPICLNSTGNEHEVCDDCLSLFATDENIVCPLPACKIPSHMAIKIRVIKEDLETSKSSHEKTLKEVLGQIETTNENLDNLSLSISGIETKLKDVQIEAGLDIGQMKIKISKNIYTGDDFHLKIEDLMTKFCSLETKSKKLDEKMKDQSEDYKSLKMNNTSEVDLKKDLKKVEDELEDFRSSVNLNTKEIKEKMLLMDNALPHSELPMNRFNLLTRYDQFQPVFTWKIKGIKEKKESKMFNQRSDSFRWTGYPIEAKANFELKEDGLAYMSMCLEVTDETKMKDVKFIPFVYYLLKCQNPQKVDSHLIRGTTYVIPTKLDATLPFYQVLTHNSWLTLDSYRVDDAVTIEIYVESQSMAREAHSRDGILNWVVKDCEKRQSLEKEGLISFHESPYFYTGPNGYKVQVQLWLNGLGEQKGKGPSASIEFLPREYERDLPRSFPHRTTVTLSNPKDPKRRVVKTVDADINVKGWYWVDLCEANELVDLIQDDTLYVRVDIVEAIE